MLYLLYFLFIPFWAVFAWGVHVGGPALLAPIALAFVVTPALDWFVGLYTKNPNAEQEERWRKSLHWAPPLFLYGVAHFAILAFAAHEVFYASTGLEVLGLGVVTGIYTGAFGINAAHELMHRRDSASRVLSNVLLASVCYQHFYIEHLYGHHLMVATFNDPASARRGESVFRFLPRTLIGSYLDAWKIEIQRKGFFSFRNRLVQGHLLSLSFLSVFASFGWHEAFFFLIQSAMAIFVLELVNYVEHYGLSRQELGLGRFEKVQPVHSWNSSHFFSNVLLFNLQRHSDHHANAGRPFTILKHHEGAPQLPSGYPAMILLSMIPGLWFRVMDKRLTEWNRSKAS